jgi:uncharacterized membrane protein HdeD (DUF308 family)
MSTSPTAPESLRGTWVWFLVLGIALILLGAVFLSSLVVATLATVLIFGILLVASGAVQLVSGILSHRWGLFFLSLLVALLDLVVGVLLIEHPVQAAAGLTLLLAAFLLVGGLARIIIALVERFPNWGWVLLNGLITFVLGIMLWRQWPEDALWVIGLFVGIDLLFKGLSWVMLALAIRSAPSQPS